MTGGPLARERGPSGVDEPYGLFGRAGELAALGEEVDAVAAGRGRLVLIGGEAGIGKTTLARELVRLAGAKGFRTLAAACHDLMHTPPYGPWLDLFGICEADPDLPEPPAMFAGGQLKQVIDQSALYADVRRFLGALTDTGPAVLLMDDIHWSDHASLGLLRQVAQRLDQWPLLLIGTYRIHEVSRNDPFYHQFPVLIREAAARRFELDRLIAADLHALVDARYASLALDERARLVDYLLRHAEGNPFFTNELLHSLEDEHYLREQNGVWALDLLDRVIVPTLVRQLIDGRAARLGEMTRTSLALAAVLGQETTLELWATVAGHTQEDLLDTIDRAVDAHLIEAAQDGNRIRFIHPLIREALYAGVLPPRRKLWHRHAAETLMADARSDPDTVAYHLQQAGDPRAWQWLEWAGNRAQQAYAWLTAAERLREAAGFLQGVAGKEQTYCHLLLRVAYLLRFADTAASVRALDEAGALARRIGAQALAAEIRYVRGFQLCYADRFAEGLAEMEGGLSTLETLPADMPRSLAVMMQSGLARPDTIPPNDGPVSAPIAVWFAEAIPTTTPEGHQDNENLLRQLLGSGIDYRRCVYWWVRAAVMPAAGAAEGSEQFVSLIAGTPGSEGGIRRANSFAYLGLGIASAALGHPERARQVWEWSRQLFGEVDHFALIAITAIIELRDIALTFGAADPNARRKLAVTAAEALERAGGALRPGVSPHLAQLGCLVLDGRWSEADHILGELPPPGNAFFRREVTAAAVVLACYRGDPDNAWPHIHSIMPAGPWTEPGNSMLQEGLFLQRIAAALCLDAGDTDTAQAWLSAHDRWLAWGNCVLGQAEGELIWARYFREMGDRERARSRAAMAITLATDPDQPLVFLAAHRLLGEVASAAGKHEEAERHLATALELAGRCEAPYERALALLALAEAHFMAGKESEVLEPLHEAREILTLLGAPPAYDRLESLLERSSPSPRLSPRPDRLTSRELDVLRLLAAGQSNQAIADGLFISRETVRTHVSSIFRKLDVHTRAEAVDLSHRQGLLDEDIVEAPA